MFVHESFTFKCKSTDRGSSIMFLALVSIYGHARLASIYKGGMSGGAFQNVVVP